MPPRILREGTKPPHRVALSAARVAQVSDAELASAGLRARSGLSLGRGFREWGCGRWGRRCRRCAFGFAQGLGSSAGCGRAAGHGSLAALLQTILTALAAAADFFFLLSHRESPCRAGALFSAISEAPKIVLCRGTVNGCERGVRFPRAALLGWPSTRQAAWARRPHGSGASPVLVCRAFRALPGNGSQGLGRARAVDILDPGHHAGSVHDELQAPVGFAGHGIGVYASKIAPRL